MTRQQLIPRNKIEEQRITKGLCVVCEAKLTGRQRTYCSYECQKEYWEKHSWNWLRVKILKRDKMTCARCGLKIKVIGFAYRIEDLGINLHDRILGETFFQIPLIVDHIKAICNGGLEFDEDNLQILCEWCSKKKTQKDMEIYYNFQKMCSVSLAPLFKNKQLPLAHFISQ